MNLEEIPDDAKANAAQMFFLNLGRRFRTILDQTVPFAVPRWAATVVFYLIFWLRIFSIKGWYIICYALAIYHLNLFIAFLTPNIDPGLSGRGLDDEEDGPLLPKKANEAGEFKPFVRRLPEFKFWYSGIKGIVIAFFTTFFEAFNVPVFWPILVMYFFILFFVTMKRQIRHMIKYKYIPFTTGKTKYAGKEDTGKVIRAQ